MTKKPKPEPLTKRQAIDRMVLAQVARVLDRAKIPHNLPGAK